MSKQGADLQICNSELVNLFDVLMKTFESLNFQILEENEKRKSLEMKKKELEIEIKEKEKKLSEKINQKEKLIKILKEGKNQMIQMTETSKKLVKFLEEKKNLIQKNNLILKINPNNLKMNDFFY
ncbi:sjoegren syndrome nuclear autoantigen 1 [Anaeramoeba ignava]|uniref:Sjoegren syndrome nuclear autoantigen 1 n=1 Tax=Anaeramoeba ignava TaxID=1746090 RepID=A0A9Q0R5Z6_ANAIG|nr:sjoegren syndrome nuclear autoantigen 1 [Anaeramoeba ignava]